MIDRSALARAADHARAAVTHVEAARALDLPLLFGRSAAKSEIRLSMDMAASAASDALALLGDDVAFVDSRRAVQTLHDAAAAIRDRGVPVSQRSSAAMRDAIVGAKLHADTFGLVAKLGGDSTSAPTGTVDVATLRAAVDSLVGGREHAPPWLADMTGLLNVHGAHGASIEAALRLRSSDEVAREIRRLVEPVTDEFSDRFDRLAGIGMLPDSMLASIDATTRKRLTYLRPLVDRSWDEASRHEVTHLVDRLWVDDVAARPHLSQQLARDLADGPPTTLTARKLGLLLEHDVATLGMTDPARYHLSSNLSYVRFDDEAAVLLDAVRTVRSNVEPYELGQEARALIAADTLTPEAVDRLRVINALPPAMRPFLIEPALLRFDELTPARLEQLHDELRWCVERAGLVRDPEAGSRVVLDEMLGYVERGDEPFLRRDVLRIARLQELGAIKGMPRWQSDAWTFREKLSRMTGDTLDLRREMQRLRGHFERGRVDVDPTITRTTQLRDLRQLLAQPDDRLDLPALERLRAIEEVAGRKGLELPSTLRELPTSVLADAAAGRGVAPELASELASMRAWLSEWDVVDVRDLERIANQPGRTALPPHVVEYIGDNWDALMADPDSLAPLTDILVRRIGGADGRDPALGRTMRMAGDLMRSREPVTPGALRTLYDETLETLERNLERMDGTRGDTYNQHPDYAELGRVAANMPLLSHIPAAARPAASAGETLTW